MIAIHPRTREVHDGSVLTVDHDKCRVQFDRPEIGVEFVMVLDSFKLFFPSFFFILYFAYEVCVYSS